MPQNRDDNARGYPRDDRSVCGSHMDHALTGIFESYADFLKNYYTQRGVSGTLGPEAGSRIEFSQELQKHPVQGAEGPPTGEDTHTIQGDPRDGGRNWDPEEDPTEEDSPSTPRWPGKGDK